MERRRSCLNSLTLLAMLFVVSQQGPAAALSSDYYKSKCPNVLSIVRDAVQKKIDQTVVTIPATLRLFFHDSFVEGCDATIMIKSPANDAKKDAPDNMSLAGDGFDTVIKAKEAVEKQCPGVVSCADILTIAARDVVALSGGPNFTVELGRYDGLVSKASHVAGNLPGPDYNVDKLMGVFMRHNFTIRDMVALSGAHTVGFAHCTRFMNRLYSFTTTTPVDPSIHPVYAKQLMQACPRDVGPTIAVNMDPVTPITFDNIYYLNLVNKLGLFSSDEVLHTDARTKPFVVEFANSQASFFTAFSEAMIKLGRLGVKSYKDGEIRTDCTAFNTKH